MSILLMFMISFSKSFLFAKPKLQFHVAIKRKVKNGVLRRPNVEGLSLELPKI